MPKLITVIFPRSARARILANGVDQTEQLIDQLAAVLPRNRRHDEHILDDGVEEGCVVMLDGTFEADMREFKPRFRRPLRAGFEKLARVLSA